MPTFQNASGLMLSPLLYWWGMAIVAGETPFTAPNREFTSVLIGALGSACTCFIGARNIIAVLKTMRISKSDLVPLSYAVLSIVASLTSYAVGVYPHLSPVFGGGKTQKIDVLINSETARSLTLFSVNPNQKIWGPLDVVLENDEAFFVIQPEAKTATIRPRTETVIRIPKTFGHLIRFHPTEYK